MATHPIGQHKTTKNPQSLMLCGFLGLRWSLLDRYLVLGESESISYVVDFKWIAYVFLGGGVAVGVTGD